MSDVEEAYKEIEKNLDIRVLKLGYIPVNLKIKDVDISPVSYTHLDVDKRQEYTVRMLTENRIPGFLPFREKQVDGERWFYYDVTSRQPLGSCLLYKSGPH